MNKNLIIGIILLVVVILLGAWFMMFAPSTQVPLAPDSIAPANTELQTDTTSSIDAELNAINIENIDGDFQDVNTDIQGL
ncbi:MAG: hypothetical protein AAB362_01680 [Patescibacteria group bacterium]